MARWQFYCPIPDKFDTCGYFVFWKEDIKGSQGQGTQVARADIQFKSRVYVLFI